MATTTKQNGKTTTQTARSRVKQQLTQEAMAPQPNPSLEQKIQGFEQLKGLTNQRHRLTETLDELNKFKYNNGDSSIFMLRDESAKEFKTTNTNLITLVTDHLQTTLQKRKSEIEDEILKFSL